MNTPQQRHGTPAAKREGFVEPNEVGLAGVIEHAPPAANGQAGEPAAAESIELPPEQWPVVVRLRKQIRNNRNELISEISFREPTGGDVNRHGNPVRVDSQNEIIIDDQKMIRMVAALSGILPPMIEQMDPRDLSTCGYRLRPFFMPDPRNWVGVNMKV